METDMLLLEVIGAWIVLSCIAAPLVGRIMLTNLSKD
jgi:hypothetical protein